MSGRPGKEVEIKDTEGKSGPSVTGWNLGSSCGLSVGIFLWIKRGDLYHLPDMYAELEKEERVDMLSAMEWVGRGSGRLTAGPRWSSMFEPSSWQEQDRTGRAVTTFSCQPEEALFSPTRRLVTEQNTFQLGPGMVFKPHLLLPHMHRILQHFLHDKPYNSGEAPELCKRLADTIKDQASGLDLPRYKFVSDVMIGQKQEQGLITGSRCLFDESRDNFVSASYENKSLFAVATLYGLYYE